jgi:hypothetical protein
MCQGARNDGTTNSDLAVPPRGRARLHSLVSSSSCCGELVMGVDCAIAAMPICHACHTAHTRHGSEWKRALLQASRPFPSLHALPPSSLGGAVATLMLRRPPANLAIVVFYSWRMESLALAPTVDS